MKVEIEEKDGVFSILPYGGMPLDLFSAVIAYAREVGHKYWLPAGPKGEYRFCKEMTIARIEECNRALKSEAKTLVQKIHESIPLPAPKAFKPEPKKETIKPKKEEKKPEVDLAKT